MDVFAFRAPQFARPGVIANLGDIISIAWGRRKGISKRGFISYSIRAIHF